MKEEFGEKFVAAEFETFTSLLIVFAAVF